MRYILFRGKAESGEWEYGHGCYDEGFVAKMVQYDDSFTDEEGYNYNFYKFVGVNPETVSQYIGLHDRNGKKIFEGDVVKNINDNLFIVKYGAFFPRQYANYLCSMYEHEIFGFHFERTDGVDFVIPEKPNVEVVGNIYDNPELLSPSIN